MRKLFKHFSNIFPTFPISFFLASKGLKTEEPSPTGKSSAKAVEAFWNGSLHREVQAFGLCWKIICFFSHVFWFETALRCFALKSTQLFQELSQPQGSEARMVPCAAEFH